MIRRIAQKIATYAQKARARGSPDASVLEKLKAIREPVSDGSLLDRTMVLNGSGMGNANSHTNSDLPLILAGGGFRHGVFREFPKEKNARVPLSNLFVTMLQNFGLETDRFSQSTGTLALNSAV